MMGDKYEFLVAGTTPLRIGKIFTAVPGFHLWHIDFTGFVAYPGGHVPLSLFSVEPGVKCKPAAAIADVSADQLVAVVPLAPVALRRASLMTLPLPDAAANANAAAATAAAAAAGSGADPCVATGERVTVNGTEYLTKFEVVTPGHAPAISRPNTAVAAQVTGYSRLGLGPSNFGRFSWIAQLPPPPPPHTHTAGAVPCVVSIVIAC